MATHRRSTLRTAAMVGVVACVALGVSYILFVGRPGTLDKNTDYLSPIPNATLWVYDAGDVIDSRMDAVVMARLGIGSSRLMSTGDPEVVWVELTTLDRAMDHLGGKEIGYWGALDPTITPVWLVVLKSLWQVEMPDPMHTVTPAPPAEGCAYAILSVNVGGPNGYGGVDCKVLPAAAQ